MSRHTVNKRKSARAFNKHAHKTKRLNVMVSRGGIRL